MILYLIAVLGAYIFSRLAEKRDEKRYVVVAALILSCIAGFRGETVGVDTPSYYSNIIARFPQFWHFREEGFRAVSNLIMDYTGNPQLVFLLCAIITSFLILFRLWDFRNDLSYSFAVLLYILLYFGNSLNVMRQYVALAIVFYITRYLEKKNYIVVIAGFIAAFLIHRSSLVAVTLCVFYIWNSLSKKQKMVLFFPVVIGVVAILGYVYMYLASDVSAYTSQSVSNTNITYFYRVAIFVLSYIFTKMQVYVKVFRNDENIECVEYSNITDLMNNNIVVFSAIGIILESLSMSFAYMGRVGLYFKIYEILYWAILVKKTRNKVFFSILILVYAFYLFGLLVFANHGGIMPYYMFIYGH